MQNKRQPWALVGEPASSSGSAINSAKSPPSIKAKVHAKDGQKSGKLKIHEGDLLGVLDIQNRAEKENFIEYLQKSTIDQHISNKNTQYKSIHSQNKKEKAPHAPEAVLRINVKRQ